MGHLELPWFLSFSGKSFQSGPALLTSILGSVTGHLLTVMLGHARHGVSVKMMFMLLLPFLCELFPSYWSSLDMQTRSERMQDHRR